LSSEEVCSIIKACGESHITELKFRGLELRRDPAPVLQLANTYPVTEITETQHNKQTANSIETEEIRLKADQIRELQISDPLAYEQMLARGELEDADDDELDDDTE
jgi:hypothetical protein